MKISSIISTNITRSACISRLIITSLVIASFFSFTSKAQTPTTGNEPTPPYSFLTYKKYPFEFLLSGYFYHGSYWDTRQVVGLGDDHDLIYPEPKKLDFYGCDINDKGQFTMVPFETNVRLDIKGPDIKSMSTKGVLHTIFTAHNLNIARESRELANLLSLYEGYMEFAWRKTNLILGYHWHPIYVLNNYANTISYNGGAPISPSVRNPQIRITQKCGNTELTLAALSQVRLSFDGPIGFSSTYLRNAVVPDLHAQFQTKINDHFFGAGIDFRRLVPRLETNKGFKAQESLISWAGMIYAGFNYRKLAVHTQLSFLQNPSDLAVIGGYAVHCIDPLTDHRSYTNLNTGSFWIDIERQPDRGAFQPGFYLGIAKNFGSRNRILLNEVDNTNIIIDQRVFGFGTDIDTLFRIAPRLRWNNKNLTIGAELEYTRAAFGTLDCHGKVRNTDPVGNIRLLLAAFYYI